MAQSTGRPNILHRPVTVLFLGLLKQERLGDVTMQTEHRHGVVQEGAAVPKLRADERASLAASQGRLPVLPWILNFDILSGITRIELHGDGAAHSLDEALHL